MKWFKKKQRHEELERKVALNPVYKDKFGNQWYEYANPMQIPAKRAIAAEVATRFADMSLTKENFLLLLAEMKKKANEGNVVELFNLLGEIEFRLNFIGEEETLKELAVCYYVIEGEDEADFTDLYREKKLDILKNDSEAKAFFLQGAFSHTIAYSNMSEIDINDYLIQNAPNEKMLRDTLLELKSAGI
jgi:hypothetical protein